VQSAAGPVTTCATISSFLVGWLLGHLVCGMCWICVVALGGRCGTAALAQGAVYTTWVVG
jgi:hypothetical protein